ncbi:hypothetical protein [Ruficoccus sp. ZRK36]|uniref:hypothetical protein n=1 Tax=Ruficoccus sp. ZRK36 TaxID=2866311 RepID=UPI001C736CA5|nr:hypothetical protein [Ruficoccus sp. ZRK36]QYY34813.1 hypothetical protein K0V07_10930 [Ruficoccus sp. ZRK36]
MTKYKECLNQIKAWVSSDNPSNTSQFSKQIGYVELNKYGSLLHELKAFAPADRPKEVIRLCEKAVKRGVSRKCFLAVAAHVFELDPHICQSIDVQMPQAVFTEDNIWSELGTLAKLVKGEDIRISGFGNLSQRIVNLAREIDRRRMSNVFMAAALIYYCHQFDIENGNPAEDRSAKFNIGKPVLEALHLPTSKSSISRFSDRFETIARALVVEEPVGIYSSNFSLWWRKLLGDIQRRCAHGADGFSDVADKVRGLPGGQGLIEASKQEEFSPSNNDSDSVLSPIEAKVDQELQLYSQKEIPQQKRMVHLRIKKAYESTLFLSKIASNKMVKGISSKDARQMSALAETLKLYMESENKTPPKQ